MQDILYVCTINATNIIVHECIRVSVPKSQVKLSYTTYPVVYTSPLLIVYVLVNELFSYFSMYTLGTAALFLCVFAVCS